MQTAGSHLHSEGPENLFSSNFIDDTEPAGPGTSPLRTTSLALHLLELDIQEFKEALACLLLNLSPGYLTCQTGALLLRVVVRLWSRAWGAASEFSSCAWNNEASRQLMDLLATVTDISHPCSMHAYPPTSIREHLD